MKTKYTLIFVSLCAVLLVGCTQNVAAPITGAPNAQSTGIYYHVQPNDTLSGIADHYHMDYKTLAQMNNLQVPYVIYVGQVLIISKGPSVQKPPVAAPIPQYGGETTPLANVPSFQSESLTFTNTVDTAAPLPAIKVQAVSAHTVTTVEGNEWSWPVSGKVIQAFGQGTGVMFKGVQIAAPAGTVVLAAGDGQVIFSGTGATGYGQMIIVKNDQQFLTAYSNLSALKVKKGAKVSRGAPIGVIGTINGKPCLHFEVRKLGNPVDPMIYMPS